MINRSAASPNTDIAECLEALLAAEVLDPGSRLVVISPWISDFPALDNSGGRFTALEPTWTTSRIMFSSVIRILLRHGVATRIACGTGARESAFLEPLTYSADLDGTLERLTVKRYADTSALDHQKALIAQNWAIFGSMNLTYSGICLNGELITVTTSPDQIAQLATELSGVFA